jgi:cobaltochelatase CobN
VYIAWSGHSYSRAGYGVPAEAAMRRRFAAIDVAVKNQDNREHDVFDSDAYLQEHGGMVATIRSLTGRDPKAWFGDSADPHRPVVRSLAEEAARVVRTRVVNPKWIDAMRRHGYKGAFEMAATVDYLFGYDATAHVVDDWMYERITAAYVADPEVRKFFAESNPWALRSIAERLLEASERDLWNASAEALATLRDAVLEAEGWEESR